MSGCITKFLSKPKIAAFPEYRYFTNRLFCLYTKNNRVLPGTGIKCKLISKSIFKKRKTLSLGNTESTIFFGTKSNTNLVRKKIKHVIRKLTESFWLYRYFSNRIFFLYRKLSLFYRYRKLL